MTWFPVLNDLYTSHGDESRCYINAEGVLTESRLTST